MAITDACFLVGSVSGVVKIRSRGQSSYQGRWSRGMILASGARGREFDSPLAPFGKIKPFCLAFTILRLSNKSVISLAVMIRACQARGPGSTPG